MNSDRDTLAGGLPHSEIPGSPIARISPGLFAACHVLHRLSVPRHPPDALASRLIIASPSPAMPHHRRAQGQAPCLPATAESGGLYEDTSLGQASGQASLDPRACSASVTSQLSLHPSINPPRSPVAVSLNLLRTSGTRWRGKPAAPRGAASLHRSPAKTQALQSPALGGGGERVRTDDLLLAKQALSQLSYTPRARDQRQRSGFRMSDPQWSLMPEWWAREDLNLR